MSEYSKASYLVFILFLFILFVLVIEGGYIPSKSLGLLRCAEPKIFTFSSYSYTI